MVEQDKDEIQKEDETQKDKQTCDEADPQWGRFKDFVKNIARVSKEELDRPPTQ